MSELIRCPHCKRMLPREAFYWNRKQRHSDERGRSEICKECERAKNRRTYNRSKKVPDGLSYDPAYGRCMEKHGQSRKFYWPELVIETLKTRFPNSPNEDLAIELGISRRTLQAKAKELGLKKNPYYLRKSKLENLRKANLMLRCFSTRRRRKHNPKNITL